MSARAEDKSGSWIWNSAYVIYLFNQAHYIRYCLALLFYVGEGEGENYVMLITGTKNNMYFVNKYVYIYREEYDIKQIFLFIFLNQIHDLINHFDVLIL